jgi:Sensors of blue-light using FAD
MKTMNSVASASDLPDPAPSASSEPGCTTTQIIYASTAARAFSVRDLSGLLAGARARNRARDISGLLVYHDGVFLEVLEGAAGDVQPLYLKIASDPRHTSCRLLLRTVVEEREFGEWSMGFVDPRAAAYGLAGYVDYSDGLPALVMDTKRAKQVLMRFREGAWH